MPLLKGIGLICSLRLSLQMDTIARGGSTANLRYRRARDGGDQDGFVI